MPDRYSIDLMQVLAAALEEAGYEERYVKRLANPALLRKVKWVIQRRSRIEKIRFLVEGDADPEVPDGYTLVSHNKFGPVNWPTSRMKLVPGRKRGARYCVQAGSYDRDLEGKVLVGANLLDLFLKHPEQLPRKWYGRIPVFMGSVFADDQGNQVYFALGVNRAGKSYRQAIRVDKKSWSPHFAVVVM